MKPKHVQPTACITESRPLAEQLDLDGEAQRVAFALALANKPRVILTNEPTAALDTENGKNLMSLLKSLVVENHSATLIVTYDHQMTEGFDRIFQFRAMVGLPA